MDIPYLKLQFISQHGNLKALYLGNPRQNSRKIDFANEDTLNVLCKILYLVCNGDITIRKQDLSALKISKRLNVLRHFFESKKSFLKVMDLGEEEKRTILKKFSALYPSILYTMFNQM